MTLLSLAGKTVAITGATGGIGSAIATRFAQEGANLLLLGRDQEKLNALHAKLSNKHPNGDYKPILQDLTSAERTLDWPFITSQHPMDVLVNCAGVSQARLLPRVEQDEIKEILMTNLLRTIEGCKYFGKQAIRRKMKSGCIVNVSSLLAEKGVPGTSVYAASKAGLIGLTKSLAVEYARHDIRVNAVLPGYIATSMTKDQKDHQGILDRIPLKRFGTPDEVADAVLFLTRNRYASGCILNLDGGLGAT